jgi:hypothetical protein
MPIGNEFPNAMVNAYQAVYENWNTTTPTAVGWLMGDGSFIQGGGGYCYADGRADFLSSDNGAGQKLGSASHPSTGLVLPAGGFAIEPLLIRSRLAGWATTGRLLRPSRTVGIRRGG